MTLPRDDHAVTGDRLRTHRALRGLSEAQLDKLASFAQIVTLPAGSTLARESQEADCFYLIEHGRAAIELHGPGRGAHVIATVGPGQLVGWSWRFPPNVWHFDVITLDPIDVLRFDAAAVRAATVADLELDRALTEVVGATMARRLEAARLQLLDLYGRRP